jgi:hypothetical protein
LAVGLAVGHPASGALASMGALNAVTCDVGPYGRARVPGIAVPQIAGGIGLALGTLVRADGWLTVLTVTASALVSGVISARGAVASACGLLLLLDVVVGAGLPMPGPWWYAPLLMLLGGTFHLLLVLVQRSRQKAHARKVVADAYRAAADLLDCCTRRGAAGYEEARWALTAALDRMANMFPGPAAVSGPSTCDPVPHPAAALAPLVEAAPAVRLQSPPLSPRVVGDVRESADLITRGKPVPSDRLPTGDSPADRIVLDALRRTISRAGVDRSPEPYGTEGRRPVSALPYDPPTAGRPRSSVAAWRYGLRLALCISLAQAVISLVPVPRSYWVPLTVTFVLKPDFGSVFSRSVLRVTGTVPGLMIAAAVLAGVPRGWWDLPVVFVLASLVPALTPRGYGHQTAAITPLILLLSNTLSHQGTAVLIPRLLDSMIGCLITLVAGYLLWPESWHTRAGARVADAVEDCANYLRSSFTDTAHTVRGHLRRRLYRDLGAARAELRHALREPPPTGVRAAVWLPVVARCEHLADAITAARVQVEHGAPKPQPTEVTALTQTILLMSSRLREPAPPPPGPSAVVPAAPGTQDTLQPLRQAVEAMETAVRATQVRPGSRKTARGG